MIHLFFKVKNFQSEGITISMGCIYCYFICVVYYLPNII